MRRALTPLLLLVILGLGVWFAWGRFSLFSPATNEPVVEPLPPPPSYETKPQVDFLAPNFELQTLEGGTVRLGDYLGRVVVVTFWATWCPFCETQLPAYAHLAATSPRDLVVLAVNRGELPEAARDFVRNYGTRPSNMVFLQDQNDTLYPQYQATSMPQSFVIDRDGVIRAVATSELLLGEARDLVRPIILAPAACPGKKYGQDC